ncbi:hypothetical protein D3C86_1522370 [compost metagenome]
MAATPSGAVGSGTETGLQVRVTGHVEEADFRAVCGQSLHVKAWANHLHGGDQIVHGPGERPDAIEAGLQRMRTDTADTAIGRLEPGDTAARRRHPHRTSGVGADGDVCKTCGDGRGRTAGGTTRHPVRRLGVHRCAGPVVDAGDAEGQFMQVGLADDLPAGVEDRVNHCGVFRCRGCIGEGTAARAGRVAGDVDGVLDGDALAIATEEEFADESTHVPAPKVKSSVLNSRCVRKWAISQVPSTQRKSMFSRVPNSSLRPSA